MNLAKQKDKIKEFWNEQACKYRQNSLATMPDTISFELESEQLIKMISCGSKVIDVGCGNGVRGVTLVKSLNCEYLGIDYSEEMIKQANLLNHENLIGNIRFEVGDVLNWNIKEKDFDVAVSMRCLINLESIDNQVAAARTIHSLLKKNGTYLMFENSLQSLQNINNVRKDFNLPEIKVRWHNFYIDENKFFPLISDYFKLEKVVDYQSTYFLLSRTLNALLTPEGKEINYLSKLNLLTKKLPSLGSFAPGKLFVLRKK